MQIEPNACEDVIKRLRRIEGQVGGIIRMLEEKRDCADVVTQLGPPAAPWTAPASSCCRQGLKHCITGTADGELRTPVRPLDGLRSPSVDIRIARLTGWAH
jgi:DNA-binding FrmR family transcriptional regulator